MCYQNRPNSLASDTTVATTDTRGVLAAGIPPAKHPSVRNVSCRSSVLNKSDRNRVPVSAVGKPAERNPLSAKVHELEAKVARLEKELHTAHTILDVQGKVAGLLGFSLEHGKDC